MFDGIGYSKRKVNRFYQTALETLSEIEVTPTKHSSMIQLLEMAMRTK